MMEESREIMLRALAAYHDMDVESYKRHLSFFAREAFKFEHAVQAYHEAVMLKAMAADLVDDTINELREIRRRQG